jgi:cyanophycinase
VTVARAAGALVLVGTVGFAQETTPRKPPEIGPARGALFIIGGGLREKALIDRFLELAGGPESPIVVIPTALESDDAAIFAEETRVFREAGARRITVLHTRDRKVADSEAFVATIREASGAYFTGGRQWRLADAYLDTRTHAELRALLARGDTKGNTVMMGDHVEGMGFLKNVAIDQHLLKRNRQFDLVEVVEAHPELLGIGIDEDTAIIVKGDRFEVVGNGYVAIYDHNRRLDSGGLFYLLAPGDRYDLKTREAERPQMKGAPVERVVKEPWAK